MTNTSQKLGWIGVGRMGGPTYTRTTDRFDMTRPQTGEIKPEEMKSGPKS